MKVNNSRMELNKSCVLNHNESDSVFSIKFSLSNAASSCDLICSAMEGNNLNSSHLATAAWATTF